MSSKYQNNIFQLDDVTKYKYKGYKYYTNILKTQILTCPLPAGSLGDAVAGFQSGGGGEAEEDDGGLSSYPQVMITVMMMAYLRMMIMVIMITTTRSLCLTQLSAVMIMNIMMMVIMMISYQKISTRSLRLTQLSASQEELRRYKVDIKPTNQGIKLISTNKTEPWHTWEGCRPKTAVETFFHQHNRVSKVKSLIIAIEFGIKTKSGSHPYLSGWVGTLTRWRFLLCHLYVKYSMEYKSVLSVCTYTEKVWI